MKNPFIKEKNNAGFFTGLIIGGIAAGSILFFYLRDKMKKAKAAAYAKEHAQDYLKDREHLLKKHKTDVHDLANIITH